MALVDAPTSEYLHFALTIVESVCAAIFALIGGIALVVFKRAYAQYVRASTDITRFRQDNAAFHARIISILCYAGIVDADGNSTGKRL